MEYGASMDLGARFPIENESVCFRIFSHLQTDNMLLRKTEEARKKLKTA